MKSLASATVRSETEARLRSVCADDRGLWGRMSATQMVRHLGCACEIATGERTVETVKVGPPWLVKFVALRSGLRWPQGLKTPPELEQLMDEQPGDFEALRARAVAQTAVVGRGVGLAGTHPFFGSMTAEDWMRWGYLHADHHLRQFGR